MINSDLIRIEADIADLPPDSQLRVNTLADILRDFIARDSEMDETSLAMLLVMEELSEEDVAIEMELAAGQTRQ
jgi:hypothetical protein